MTVSYDSPIGRSHNTQASPVSTNTKGQRKVEFLPLGRQADPIRIPGTNCLIKPQISLSSLTSFRVGGPAELYAAPRSIDDLQACFEWADQHDVPVTLLGAGTNLLVSDRGLSGLVICTRRLRFTEFDDDAGQVTVGAGVPIARLAWQVAERGWTGLEWAVGIPGTVGGSVVMNAGAHRSCMADILVNTRVLGLDNAQVTLNPENLGYAYRTSNLQGGQQFVTQATLQLAPGSEAQTVLAVTEAHLEQRRRSQPYHLPSCGSVFRNPLSHSAGWLIEQTGLKGHQIGGAQVAQRHANFILNCGGATATDIFNLIHHVQQNVDQQWSLRLHPEVKMIGEF